VGAVGEPVHLFYFVDASDAFKCVVSGLQHGVVWHVLGVLSPLAEASTIKRESRSNRGTESRSDQREE